MTNLSTEEKYNALYQAFEECVKEDGSTLNEWLEERLDTYVVRHLVDKLEELGYIIVKK